MMPVDEGKISLGRSLQQPSQLPADLLAGPDPGFTSGTVGIARVHDHGANPAAAGRQ